MPKRYEQLLALIDECRPQTIVEIGVHRARRAAMMVERAMKWKTDVWYQGYDVFETMSADFQEDALNGKGVATKAEAEHRLGQLPKGARWSLTVGNTIETLKGRSIACDFAFIDGDHRVEVIRSDYEAVRRVSKIVVFDDYFRVCEKGTIPDLARYGANAVVNSLDPATVEILPLADPCNHGGVSHLAVVRRK